MIRSQFQSNACDFLVDCKYIWSSWGPCSATCGEGVETRRRTVEQQAMFGGRECVMDREEVRNCTTKLEPCPSNSSTVVGNTNLKEKNQILHINIYRKCGANFDPHFDSLWNFILFEKKERNRRSNI